MVMQNEMKMTMNRSKSKLEYNMAIVCFSKPKVVITQPWIEIPGRNLVWKLILTFVNESCH